MGDISAHAATWCHLSVVRRPMSTRGRPRMSIDKLGYEGERKRRQRDNNITEDYATATVPESRRDTNDKQRESSSRDAERREALVQARVKNKLAQRASRRKKKDPSRSGRE